MASIRLFNSNLHKHKVQYFKFRNMCLPNLGLQVLIRVAHTSVTSHAPGGGVGSNSKCRTLKIVPVSFVAAGGICV